MLLLNNYPSIIEYFSPYFESCFDTSRDYKQFKRAITGLLLSDNKTLEAMNRLLLIDQIDQSNFNRFFHRIVPKLSLVNEKRLALLQSKRGTAIKSSGPIRGVLSIDNSLLKHYGKHFEHISYQRDYVHGGFRWCHDLVSLYYSDDQTDYPIDFKLWQPANWSAVIDFYREQGVSINEAKVALKETDPRAYRIYANSLNKRKASKFPAIKSIYKTKIDLAEDLVLQFKAKYPDTKLPIVLDSGFASGTFCEKLYKKYGFDYIGAKRLDTSFEDEQGQKVKFQTLVDQLRKQLKDDPKVLTKIAYSYRGKKSYRYTYTFKAHVSQFKRKQKIVISFTKVDATDRPLVLVSNRFNWNPSGILRMWRHRWPVETYHQEGKAVGLESYQVRNWGAIHSYIQFIAVAYSMLKAVPHHPILLEKLQRDFPLKIKNNTLPFLRRLMKAESIMFLILNAFNAIEQGQDFKQWFEPLLSVIAY